MQKKAFRHPSRCTARPAVIINNINITAAPGGTRALSRVVAIRFETIELIALLGASNPDDPLANDVAQEISSFSKNSCRTRCGAGNLAWIWFTHEFPEDISEEESLGFDMNTEVLLPRV
ncbi:hypothetical protein EK21DRAFT_86027 [Setomelanomma holmii]|uniref:Uncharacterized protein n=1 Tax=Setomelanomma holmii TaxID=210430 RepID=A0A9P4HHX8_9PLEO|nr:hypothetical protein EK21DRAFT_86027 [Setomelanomma holmii]